MHFINLNWNTRSAAGLETQVFSVLCDEKTWMDLIIFWDEKHDKQTKLQTQHADDMLNSHMQAAAGSMPHTDTSNQHAAGSTPPTRSNNIYKSAATQLWVCHLHITLISDMFESSSFLRNASSVSNALTISLRYLSYSKPKFWKWNDVTWLNYMSCWRGESAALCVKNDAAKLCVYVWHNNKSLLRYTIKHWRQWSLQ